MSRFSEHLEIVIDSKNVTDGNNYVAKIKLACDSFNGNPAIILHGNAWHTPVRRWDKDVFTDVLFGGILEVRPDLTFIAELDGYLRTYSEFYTDNAFVFISSPNVDKKEFLKRFPISEADYTSLLKHAGSKDDFAHTFDNVIQVHRKLEYLFKDGLKKINTFTTVDVSAFYTNVSFEKHLK